MRNGLYQYAMWGQQRYDAERKKLPPTLSHQALKSIMLRDYHEAFSLTQRFHIPVYFWNHPNHAEILKYSAFAYRDTTVNFAIMTDGRLGVSSIIKSSLWPTKQLYLFDVGLSGVSVDKYGIFTEPLRVVSYHGKLDTDAYLKAKAKELDILENDVLIDLYLKWKYYNPRN